MSQHKKKGRKKDANFVSPLSFHISRNQFSKCASWIFRTGISRQQLRFIWVRFFKCFQKSGLNKSSLFFFLSSIPEFVFYRRFCSSGEGNVFLRKDSASTFTHFYRSEQRPGMHLPDSVSAD